MNMPYRRPLDHDRLAQTSGLALVACLVGAFIIPDLWMWLLAATVCVIAIRMVQSEWLDVSVRAVTLGNILTVCAGALIGFAVGYSGPSLEGLINGELDLSVGLLFGKIAVGMLVCGCVYLAYRWRRFRRIRFLQSNAPAENAVDRISVLGALFHLAGYIVGFALAAVAISQLPHQDDKALAFLTAFLAGKLAVDFFAPEYAPVSSARTSQVLLRMAAISPLWWALPWSFVLGLGSTLVSNENANVVLYFLLDVAIQAMLPCFLLVTGCFCAMAIIGLLLDLAGSRGREDALPGQALDQPDWVRLFLGVAILTVVAFSVVYQPPQRFGQDLYGVERWTCAKRNDEYAVGWVAKAGVHIMVHDNYIQLFNASCVPRADSKRCEYDDEGWEELEFEFHQMRGTKILSYARGQEDVKSELRHHGDLVVNAAADLITEMLRSKDFTLTIKAEKQRKLYSVNANLSKFPREYGVCTMHWRESAAEQQANR